jgi:hypothetical protein
MVGQSPYPLGSHPQTPDAVVRSILLDTKVMFVGEGLPAFSMAQTEGRSSLISPHVGRGPLSPRLVCHGLGLLRLLIVKAEAGLARV